MNKQRNNNRPRRNFNKEPITWDYRYLHKHSGRTSKRPSIGKLTVNMHGRKNGTQYSGDMLMLAKGQSFIKINT